MAFIELTEDEVVMLSESEKEQYNKEQMLYQERAAFVEKLEQIEKAGFQYQKPKMERIKPVCRVEIPKYRAKSIALVLLPKSLERRRDFKDRINAQVSRNGRIRARINSKYKITEIPVIKIETLTLHAIHSKKHEIKNVLESKKRIKAPTLNVKPIEIQTITKMTIKKKAVAPSVSFQYKGKPITITPAKVRQPGIMNFTAIDAIKLEKIPVLSIMEVANKKYRYSQNNAHAILKVRNIAIDAKINSPRVMFKPKAFKIQDVTKPRVSIIDTTEVAKRMERIAIGTIDLRDCMAKIPTAPSFGKYKKPVYKAAVSGIGKVFVPRLKKYKEPNLKITVEPPLPFMKHLTPALGRFQVPPLPSVKGVAPQKVKLPNCSVDRKERFIVSGVSTVRIQSPSYTQQDVNNVVTRIMNVIKGRNL